ncbi:MAG: tetratricopeptide repeat protein [Aquificaceae bacterium]
MQITILRIIGVFSFVLLLSGALLGWKWWEEKKLSKISYEEFLIRERIVSGDYKDAESLMNDALKSSTPYKPLILSYKLYLERENGKGNDIKYIEEILNSLEDKDLRSIYQERLAYAYFLSENYQKALDALKSIEETRFNYYSAMILKGLILEKVGRKEEAEKLYAQVMSLAKGTYFGNLAEAMLTEER